MLRITNFSALKTLMLDSFRVYKYQLSLDHQVSDQVPAIPQKD